MKYIYLDHAATSPLHKQVKEAMWPVFNEVYGNPSSVHSFGRIARKYVDQARQVIATSIQGTDKEIIFTSGGTEANNLALIGTARANRGKGNHIITTKQEHHAVLHAAQYLEAEGFQVTYLPVNKNGQIRMDDLINALTDETIIVSIMYVNNETGIIQPINEVAHILRDHQAYFHTDAVQAYGLLNINVKQTGIDLLTTSAHKINGPKGAGFLYVSDKAKINPINYGGDQERKHRPGTENVASIVGFQVAAQLALENKETNVKKYEALRKLFIDSLRETGIHFELNGDPQLGLPSIVNISFPGTNVEALLTNFDLEGIAASSGSACTAGTIEPSHVLSAMYDEGNERITNSVRFSFGINNTSDNIIESAKRIGQIVTRLTGAIS